MIKKIKNFVWNNAEISCKLSNDIEESRYFRLDNFLEKNEVSLDKIIKLAHTCNNLTDLNIGETDKIAVVGNSGILMDTEMGEEIDKHDIIIRCNRAKIEGFEKHVGSKTTLRMVATKSAGAYDLSETFSDWNPEFLANLKDEHLILCGQRINQLLIGFFNNRKVGKIHFLKTEFIDEVIELVGNYPSVGLLSICLAVSLSTNVDIYGFNFFKEDWKSQHYFEDVKPHSRGHDFKDEEDYVNLLSNKKLITIRR
tara:strand:+ start:5027 stop:5788 length:762 start_codon:yes stop_codon:yes gene_type:complete